MQKTKYLITAILVSYLAFVGFSCGSTELTSAKLYIQQKNYPKAIEVLKKEVAKNPKSDEGYYLLGVIYGEQENYDEMLDAFNKSLEASKVYEKDINSQKKYYWANNFNKGVSYFQKANKTSAEDSSKVFYDKSIEAFETAVKIAPDSVDSYKNLAFVYLASGQNDKAVPHLKKVIEKTKSEDAYRFLGEIYYNKGKELVSTDEKEAMKYFDMTISLLEEAKQLYPANTDILQILSNAYISSHRADMAIDKFKEGIEKDPKNKYYRYNYGVLLLGKNDFAAAEEQFKKAIEIDPEYKNAIYNLGVTYVKWGAMLSKKEDENTDVKTGYKEKYKAALPYLEKVLTYNDKDATLWELLGKVYAILGMNDKATEAFNKADSLK